MAFVVVGILLLVLGALWKWTPLQQWVQPSLLVPWLMELRAEPFSPLLLLGVYVAGGVVMFPVTALLAATVWAFGPWPGVPYAITGALCSAFVMYGVGRRMGARRLAQWGGQRTAKLSQLFERRGVLLIAAVRLMPIAPFSVVNLTAGALKLPPLDFALGTVLGMTPGLVVFSLVGQQLQSLSRPPSFMALGLIGLGLVVAVAAGIAARQWASRFLSGPRAAPEGKLRASARSQEPVESLADRASE